jgi:hypothetical protein
MDRISGQHQFKLSQLRSISLKIPPQFAAIDRLCSIAIYPEKIKTASSELLVPDPTIISLQF